ncbi:L-type lectin-domain containing receptor kinase IX.1-like [Senna tora]|uniref:non-specific serine/threonine protein kinase n=1 Tax=Senna tora TaxID=362788 RepID=A0A834XD67_9FABA|nr:L-type lectin-domain containing receptor kinase IX.1-like [Senna tora]
MEASHKRMKIHLLPCLAITKIFWFLIIIPPAASITFNYQQFLDKNNYEQNLKLKGDVYQENGFLQLTRNGLESAGRVTYKKQLQLWDPNTKKLADFTTHFSFSINSSNPKHSADGITFFLAHPNFSLPVPPDGSGIGLVGRTDPNYPEKYPFVAVEFDTFPNQDLGDPPYEHVGIDVNNMWTQYTTQWYYVNDSKKVFDAEITYNSSSHLLNAAFTGYKNDTKIHQNYSHQIDLRDFLPSQVQFGISSATGDIYGTHTLCSWSFNSSDITLESYSKKKKKKVITGVSIGLVVLICGLFLAWLVIWKKEYHKRKKDHDFDHSLDIDFESIGPKKFSYKELVKATNNFAEEKKLGEGGFARYDIAQGLASAILYLHEEWKHYVVHRDIKPSNIMLDSNFNAKLGDFGLARLVEHGKGSSETTVVAGTKGYMAPECVTVSKATKESDVYSFGVVALELACGRKPIVLSTTSEEQVVMVEWVWEMYGMEKLLEAADPRLCGHFKEQELERLMIVGLWSAHPDYVLRPSIRQAMNVLNFEASVPILPPKMPKATYDIRQIQASNSDSYTGSSQATTSDTALFPR